MKRAAVWLIVLLIVITAIPSAMAAEGFYCEYAPKSANSSLFYIDVYSSDEISATVMELRFDSSFAEYREVSAIEKTSAVRSVCENGCVKIAFADSGAVKGNLCRVEFKAIQAGTCPFILHIDQAADAEPRLLGAFPDATIEAKIGKDAAAASASSKSSSKSSRAGSLSSIKEASEPDDFDDSVISGGIIDMRKSHALNYILLGAGIVVLMALLVLMGIILGRKTMQKPKKPSAGEPDGSDSSALQEADDDITE